jgi:hypothetical protein
MTLIVLIGAFADPSFVRSEADRQPRTTLLVLRYLELSTDDPKLTTRIADAKKYIEDSLRAVHSKTVGIVSQRPILDPFVPHSGIGVVISRYHSLTLFAPGAGGFRGDHPFAGRIA